MNLPAASPAPPLKQKRRWWLIALVAAGVLLLLAGGLLIAVGSYWSHLLATYTETQPAHLPKVNTAATARERLQTKWDIFSKAVAAGKAPASLQLSDEDLNVFLANLPDLKERVYVRIERDQLRAQFSVPLEKPGNKQLRGRHLNGRATLKLAFTDGFLWLNVVAVEAKGKPIPGWLLSKLRSKNLLHDLNQSSGLFEVMQSLESVQVKDGLVIVNTSAEQ